jgi:hypothetical protein
MKSIYYLANSIYQFAYALPVYNILGGIFIVPSEKKARQFRRYMKDQAKHGEINQNNSPNLLVKNRHEVCDLTGILFFLANTIVPELSYPRAITIFHEHGTSDKLYEGGDEIAIHKLNKYDYIFLSGPKNRHRMLDIGLKQDDDIWISVGAPRMIEIDTFEFLAIQSQYRQQLHIASDNRPVVLYAPTWRFGNGTLREHVFRLASELKNICHLIIRPHYHDRRIGRWIVTGLRSLGFKHVYYSDPSDIINHDTYAAFAASDILVSDFSSVVYEYLWTRRPMIIIDNGFKDRHTIHPDYSIFGKVPIYKPSEHWGDLVLRVLEKSEVYRSSMDELLKRCFYCPSGGAAKAMAEFISCHR